MQSTQLDALAKAAVESSYPEQTGDLRAVDNPSMKARGIRAGAQELEHQTG